MQLIGMISLPGLPINELPKIELLTSSQKWPLEQLFIICGRKEMQEHSEMNSKPKNGFSLTSTYTCKHTSPLNGDMTGTNRNKWPIGNEWLEAMDVNSYCCL